MRGPGSRKALPARPGAMLRAAGDNGKCRTFVPSMSTFSHRVDAADGGPVVTCTSPVDRFRSGPRQQDSRARHESQTAAGLLGPDAAAEAWTFPAVRSA